MSEAELSRLRLEVVELQEQLRQRQQRQMDLQRMLNKANQQLLAVSEQRTASTEKLHRFAQAAGQRDALAEELKSRTQQLEELRSQLNLSLESTRLFQSHFESLQSQMRDLQQQRDALQASLDAQQGQAQDWRQRVTELQQQLAAAENMRAYHEQRLQTLAQLESEVARTGHLQHEVERLQMELAEQREHNQTLRTQISSWERSAASLNALESQLAEAREQVMAKEVELVELRLEVQELHDVSMRLADQTRELSRLEGLLAHREAELQKERTRSAELQQRASHSAALEARLQQESEEKQRLLTQLERTRQSLGGLQARIRELEEQGSEADVKPLHEELARLRGRAESAEAQLARLEGLQNELAQTRKLQADTAKRLAEVTRAAHAWQDQLNGRQPADLLAEVAAKEEQLRALHSKAKAMMASLAQQNQELRLQLEQEKQGPFYDPASEFDEVDPALWQPYETKEDHLRAG